MYNLSSSYLHYRLGAPEFGGELKLWSVLSEESKKKWKQGKKKRRKEREGGR